VFPSSLLHGGTPSLVSRCVILWPKAPFSENLTQLVLVNHLLDAGRPSLKEFMDLMKTASHLELLELSGFLPSVESAQRQDKLKKTTPFRITLPKLVDLKLDDKNDLISQFMKMVQLPNAESVLLHFRETVEQSGEIDSIFSYLDGTWFFDSRLKGRVVNCLRLTGRDKNDCFGGHQTYFSFEDLASDPAGNHQLPLSFWRASFSVAQVVQNCRKRFDFSSLSSIALAQMDDDAMAPWDWDTFSIFPSVKTVVFEHSSLASFIKELTEDPALRASTNASSAKRPVHPTSPMFPSISTIRLVHLRMHFGRDGHEGDSVTSLLKLFQKRAKVSRPVQRLEIERCDQFRKEDYARVYKGVPGLKIVWDMWGY
jgi:hypothetical protein